MTMWPNKSRGCVKTPGVIFVNYQIFDMRVLTNQADGLDGQKMSFHTGSRCRQQALRLQFRTAWDIGCSPASSWRSFPRLWLYLDR